MAGLGGAAVTWPLVARAQQSAIPVVGFLNAGGSDTFAHFLVAFRQGLADAGYVEGQNVALEVRWAEGQYDRLPGLAGELVQRPVAVLVSGGAAPAAVAAKRATQTIPIVFSASDPVRLGLVNSLNRPGGNATGMNLQTGELEAKRFELLTELVPKAGTIGILVNPTSLTSEDRVRALRGAAAKIARQIHVVGASNEQELHDAFQSLAQPQVGALFVASDPFFLTLRAQIVTLARHYSLPAAGERRDFALAGALLSYGTDLVEIYRQLGRYTGRVLKGEKPADLPVMQPTKYDLVINLRTAKALGLEVPHKVLALADEVIE